MRLRIRPMRPRTQGKEGSRSAFRTGFRPLLRCKSMNPAPQCAGSARPGREARTQAARAPMVAFSQKSMSAKLASSEGIRLASTVAISPLAPKGLVA